MKLKKLFLGSVLTATLLPDLSAATQILPLGDSITQGSGTVNSYRRQLWHMLNQAGYSVDFVGSQAVNGGSLAPNPDFDLHHEGHARFRADEIFSSLATWLSGYTPDIVLLQIGTNDAIQNDGLDNYLAQTMGDIEQIINRLRSANPNVVILLARVIPLVEDWLIPEPIDYSVTERLDALNAQIPGIASVMNTSSSPVVVVEQHEQFNPAIGADTFDGVHPNISGESKMAAKWFQALLPYLSKDQAPQPEALPPSEQRPPDPSGLFYRGINVGGEPVVINGNSWEGQSAANYRSTGALHAYPGFAFVPAVDTHTSDMLRSFAFGTDVQLEISAVPEGSYEVYLWSYEDSVPLTSELSVQGTAVGVYTSGPVGHWDRLGPYLVEVRDGVISVGLKTVGDLGFISGVEVWKMSNGDTTAPAPTPLRLPAGRFYRAINLGGEPVVLNGNPWERSESPNFSALGTSSTYPSFNLDPPVDSVWPEMLRTFVYGSDVQLTMSAVPNGSYEVYIWTMEDNDPVSADVSIQGTTAATYVSGPAGRWDRLGPYPASVVDGVISVGWRTASDSGQICGLEVWEIP